MKTLKTQIPILLLLLSSIFICANCEKDDRGYWVSYYKKKTGEGYVFFKFENDSITPISNLAVEIISYAENPWDMFSTGPLRSTSIVYTNNNGKYFFKLVKKIDDRKVYKYNISIHDISKGYFPNLPNFPNFPNDHRPVRIDDMLVSIVHTPFDIEFNANLLQDSPQIIVDTIFFHSDTTKIRL